MGYDHSIYIQRYLECIISSLTIGCYRPFGAGTTFPPLRGYKSAPKPGVRTRSISESKMKALLVAIMALVLGLAGYSVYLSNLHKVYSDVQLPRIVEFKKEGFSGLSQEQAAEIAVGINVTYADTVLTTNRQFSKAHQINKLLFGAILILCALVAYLAFGKKKF